jgi:hypothetical protein
MHSHSFCDLYSWLVTTRPEGCELIHMRRFLTGLLGYSAESALNQRIL